ncbi:MAG: dihydropteroate synthase [Prolixibacteraceae bacterium]|jgi:dihydropteroate synthase|nr:dihydropteroate synthase [Prolixibacteraceae bacterium]MDI9563672.1 dihydropteroate synthase [Bacteroidota bacterium]NLT00651.1 dihydropteroate synthase [Bacteroidales bacterium]OQB80007.1 MAG: Dihydropteroate synthase [Bacteroidetes bacterium ADurb.Bin123]HNU78737.1 dihydropteroate synthase [Prolixibacteraceae bacterium]
MLITQSAGRFLKRKRSINVGGDLLDFTEPCIMGVINVTPDSFYDGGTLNTEVEILGRVEQLVSEGAAIIDVGSISTRPGAEMISTKDELSRLIPAVAAIRKHFPEVPISVDTFRSWVAVRVIEEIGPVIVNDISGGSIDAKMFETIGKLQVPYVLTHIQGTPANMQEDPWYKDVVHDVSAELSDSVRKLTRYGVADVLIDPGFGFGKNLDHNYKLLNRLDSLKVFQLPVVVGLSRKSMIWKVLEITPEESLNGTTVLNTMALLGGADILRVHDVKPAMEAIRLFMQLKESL